MQLSDSLFIVASGASGFGISNELDCTVYLIKTASGFLLIDTGSGSDTETILQNIEKAGFSLTDCRGILLTHAHADHAGGARELSRKCGAAVYALEESAAYLSQGNWDKISLTAAIHAFLYPADYTISSCPVTPIDAQSPLILDEMEITVIDTPGHCSGHCCYLITLDGRTMLFSGDCVFLGGKISLQDIWDCNISAYAASIRKLYSLNIDALLPSHYGLILSGGRAHLHTAYQTVRSLGIPKNAGYFL